MSDMQLPYKKTAEEHRDELLKSTKVGMTIVNLADFTLGLLLDIEIREKERGNKQFSRGEFMREAIGKAILEHAEGNPEFATIMKTAVEELQGQSLQKLAGAMGVDAERLAPGFTLPEELPGTEE